MNRLVHFEIHAENPEKMMEFYKSVFGWTFQRWGQEEYWMVFTGKAPDAGIDGGLMKRKGPKPTEGSAVNAFVCTMQVASVDESINKVLSVGGSLAVPKVAMTGMAWLAYCKDPDGNIFGLYQEDKNAK